VVVAGCLSGFIVGTVEDIPRAYVVPIQTLLAEIRTLLGDVKVEVAPLQAASGGLVHAQVPTSSGNRHPNFDTDNSSISSTEQPSKAPASPMTVQTQSQSTQANARPHHDRLKVRLSQSQICLLTSN